MLADLTRRLEFAQKLVAEAAPIAMKGFRSGILAREKADKSPVTEADIAIEEQLRHAIARHYPADGIFGEERGESKGNSDLVWVLDPIDGTRAYITGHPLFGIMVGMVRGAVPLLGVVAMPRLSEVYAGAVGVGAWCNRAPARVSARERLNDAAIHINEANLMYGYAPDVLRALSDKGAINRHAHDCYSYALLASGFIDAVVDFDLAPYDFLPLAGLALAAGAVVTDWQGRAITQSSDGTVLAAATPQLHRSLLATIAPALRGGVPKGPRHT